MTILDEILASKVREVASLVDATGPARRTPPRSFMGHLRAHGPVALIAEIKRKSPSRPSIREAFEPAAMALAYEAGGAAALSVLTDSPYFGGCLADMAAARAAVKLPVLRKDFLIDPRQVREAHAAGADAVLLIAAALGDDRLREMMAACEELGLEALLEVHTADEMRRALALEAPLVGINNRDLKTFTVDLGVTRDLAMLARTAERPPLLVSESGIATAEDRRSLEAWGVSAMLVGESLLRQDDLALAARELLT
ncbi:MAG TPA: indole-3-glycerol phosphate synthase TrpC [Pantanalinema sp.]